MAQCLWTGSIAKRLFFPLWFLVVLEIKLQGLQHREFSTTELHPHRMQSSYRSICAAASTAALYTVLERQNNPNSHQQINKYKRMRWNSTLERKEILTQATTWSTPVNTVLNERSHVQEDKYYQRHRIIATEERRNEARNSQLRGRGNGNLYICYKVLFGMLERFCSRNGSNSSIAMWMFFILLKILFKQEQNAHFCYVTYVYHNLKHKKSETHTWNPSTWVVKGRPEVQELPWLRESLIKHQTKASYRSKSLLGLLGSRGIRVRPHHPLPRWD